MKHINHSFVMSSALASVLLGGIGSAWAEENAENPPQPKHRPHRPRRRR